MPVNMFLRTIFDFLVNIFCRTINIFEYKKRKTRNQLQQWFVLVVQVLVGSVDLEAGVGAWVGGLADLNVAVGGSGLDGDRVNILSLKLKNVLLVI